MSFIYPLGLLGLLAIPIIIIIYLLRSKYKSKNVSSTFIWKRSLKYVKRKIPLNFIMSLLLILQILTVVAASFAIARPTVKPLKSEEKVVIIDASASMLAEKGGVTRFEYAIQQVKEATQNAGSNNQYTILLAGETVKELTSRETDRGEILTKLDGLKCTMGNADISAALLKAGDVLNQNSGAKVLLYTDKTYINADGVEIVDCKRDGEWNAGVINFEDNELANGTEFIASVGNYGLGSSCSIKLLIDGKVAGQKTLSLEANQIRTVRFTHSTTQGADDSEIKIELSQAVKSYTEATVVINSEDNFEYDDSFTIYPKEKINPKILYVSKYVDFNGGKVSCTRSLLYRAFLAVGYSIDSSNMYSSVDQVDEYKGYDLYIFEGVEPYDIPTDGAVWILDAKQVPDKAGIVIDNTEYDAAAMGNKNGFKFEKTLSLDIIEELVKNVYFDPMKINLASGPIYVDAALTKYRPIINKGTFKPVFTAQGQDVMVAGNIGSVRMIVTSFDFTNSSLGAYVSDFPILVWNMVNYSIPDPLPDRTATVGTEVSFNYPAGATTITYNFNGEMVNKKDLTGQNSSDEELVHKFVINEPGKYELVVTYPDGDDADTLEEVKRYIVTGHVSENESMIVQRVPTESISAPEPQDGTQETFEPVEIFPYLIALLILLLIIEWGVYYRDQY